MYSYVQMIFMDSSYDGGMVSLLTAKLISLLKSENTSLFAAPSALGGVSDPVEL